MILRIFLLLAIATTAFSQDSTSVSTLTPSTFNKELMAELNGYRKKNLRWPVKYNPDPKRQAATDAWAERISKPKQMHHAKGGFYGEVIQQALRPEDIIPRFMDSPGHRKALLSRKASTVTVAVYAVPVTEKYITGNVPFFYNYYAVIRTYRKAKS